MSTNLIKRLLAMPATFSPSPRTRAEGAQADEAGFGPCGARRGEGWGEGQQQTVASASALDPAPPELSFSLRLGGRGKLRREPGHAGQPCAFRDLAPRLRGDDGSIGSARSASYGGLARFARHSGTGQLALAACNIALALAVAVTISGCRPFGEFSAPAMGLAPADATQRHPILVTSAPAGLSIGVRRDADGLSPKQRAQVFDFFAGYRARANGASLITVAAPSGAANEAASEQAVGEIRELAREAGIPRDAVVATAFRAHRYADPPIRLSYETLVADAPDCGSWPTNLADDRQNLPYPNLGCATQRNFAVQVANPGDILGPRGMTPPAAERRAAVWDKYIKGESMISEKQDDERATTKTDN